MPLQATSGAASQDAYGGNGVAVVPAYIEEVFSCFLYTGNNTTQTITNNIDLASKGGLVWNKDRNNANGHVLVDSAVGLTKYRKTESTAADSTTTAWIFNSNGYVIPAPFGNVDNQVSWTFCKQPKFFDIVTYTGNGSNRTIAHNLGSAPGCMIVKCTSNAVGWNVYHRSLTSAAYQLELNTTSAEFSDPTIWNSTAPTSSVFSVGTNLGINGSGRTYVAYLFAHDAGGFGLTGTDNVISCGSYTGNGSTSGPTINLGYEPQWLLVKNATTIGNWFLMDNMRGIQMTGDTAILKANTSAAEDNNQGHAIELNGTGFQVTTSFTGTNGSGDTLIYIAIRRGPMKVPTTGTSVFTPVNLSSSGTLTSTANFPIDLIFYGSKSATDKWYWFDRLRGTGTLQSNSTALEDGPYPTNFASNVNFQQTGITGDFSSYISYDLRRSPSFFDEVCYTGTGSATTFSHNLASVPELMIVKRRSAINAWAVYANNDNTDYLVLNTTAATSDDNTYWNDTSPTSSVFSVGTNNAVNASAATYVAYLFATCAGVSKVFSYTGNGSSQTINCGFTGGARFVLIKRTDSTGDWYVWDTTRGIAAGNDPHLSLNTAVAEVTTDDTIDTDNTGFVVNQVSATNVNVSSATYIGLAIA